MTATLEDRLRAFGDQLDRLIEAQPLPLAHGVTPAAVQRPQLRRRLAVVALAAALLVVALVWVFDRPSQRRSVVPATVASGPAPGSSDTATTSGAVIVGSSTAAPASPVAIGASVMLGAAEALEAGGFRVVAEPNVLAAGQIDTVGALAAAGELGDTVVVDVGVNGPVSGDQFAVLAELLVDVETVVFLTAHADGFSWAQANNELLWSLPAEYPNVTVLDWDGLVDFGNVPGMAEDGVHLGTDASRQVYANYVFDAVGRPELAQPLEGYRAFEELGQLLPPLPTVTDDSDPVELTALDIDVAMTTQGSRVCLTSYNEVGSGSTCTDGRPTGLLPLIVGSPGRERPSEYSFVHRADVVLVGDDHCTIVTTVAASGLAVSACDVGEFAGAIHLTFTLPDGTSVLTSPFGTARNSGLPSASGFNTPSLEGVARHLPGMHPNDGSWGPVAFLDAAVAVDATDGRPCLDYLLDGVTIGGCPPDGQRTGLVAVVEPANLTESNTVVLLHDASVSVTAVGCVIERLDIAASIAVSGCTADARLTQVVLDLAHDGRVEHVVVPFDG